MTKCLALAEKLSLKRLSEINEVNLIMQIVLKKSETTSIIIACNTHRFILKFIRRFCQFRCWVNFFFLHHVVIIILYRFINKIIF